MISDRDTPTKTDVDYNTLSGNEIFLSSFDQDSPSGHQDSSHPLPLDSPNFQKLFWKDQRQFPLQPANGQYRLQPSPPLGRPSRAKPSAANRASASGLHRQGQQNQPPKYHPHSPKRDYSMSDAENEDGQRRISPRTGKGINSKYQQKNGQKEKTEPKLKDAPHTTYLGWNKEKAPPAANANEIQPKPTDSTPNGQPTKKRAPESSADAHERMKKELEPSLKKDKEMKKAELIKTLSTLRTEKWVAEHNLMITVNLKNRSIKEAKKNKETLQEAMDHLTRTTESQKAAAEELTKLRKELAQMEKDLVRVAKERDAAIKKAKASSKAAGKQPTFQENKGLMDVIKVKVDFILWGIVKFIQAQDEEEVAAKMLVHYGSLPEEFVDTPEKKAAVAQNYSAFIKKTLFLRRSYTTAEEKKYYEKMWKAGKATLSLEDLVMCLGRDIKTQEDMDKFMVYWEEILPNQVGKLLWNRQTKYYNTISQALNKECTTHDIPLVTPEHEAFMVLSIENHLKRWRTNLDNGVEEKYTNNNGIYTKTTSGQNQYGGWSSEGLEKYNEYLKMNMAARDDITKANVEKNCLQQLRAKYNIKEDNYLDQQKLVAQRKSAKKRGRAEEPMPVMKKVVRTMRHKLPTSDEETEEDDE